MVNGLFSEQSFHSGQRLTSQFRAQAAAQQICPGWEIKLLRKEQPLLSLSLEVAVSSAEAKAALHLGRDSIYCGHGRKKSTLFYGPRMLREEQLPPFEG